MVRVCSAEKKKRAIPHRLISGPEQRHTNCVAGEFLWRSAAAAAMTVTAGSRPVWQPNSESSACEKCRRHFTLVFRRHHCRGCGKVVCDKCSEHRVILPESYNYGPSKQRVCDTCYVTLVAIEYQLGLEQGKVVPPDYPAIRTDLLRRVNSYLSLPEIGWGSEGDHNGVKVSMRSIESSPVSCIRSKMLIKAPIKKVMEVYSNMDVWRNWNPYVSSRTVEQVDGTSKVMTAVYEFPVIDKRDSCFFTSIMDSSTVEALEDHKGLTVAAISVDHPLCPVEKGMVRSDMHISLSLLEPVDDGIYTHFTSIVHSDPKGLLPPFVINAFLSRGSDHLRGMAKFIEAKLQS
ncbi:hypothetical protein R1flu_027825 [Riccia fluitans]|uniref:FYVE-type domain-containing protein n=1 Tax=Riccia fluitans TaxID=41844 RepID=A0ABD1XJZ2_9MARC